MTVAVFFMQDGACRGFQVSGHSGWADAGQDIVCAAVTSAVRLAECILTDALSLPTKTVTDERLAAVKVALESDSPAGQSVLIGLRLHLQALSEEYPENLKVLEV